MTISGTTVIHVAIILVAKKCAINAKGVVAYEENQAIFIMNAQIARSEKNNGHSSALFRSDWPPKIQQLQNTSPNLASQIVGNPLFLQIAMQKK